MLGAVSAADGSLEPGDNIQAAVDSAAPGEEITLAPGTYTEQQVVIDKPLTLRGDPGGSDTAGPGRNPPVLDGNNTVGTAITLVSGVTDVTIEGLDIRNYGDGPGNGRGVTSSHSSARITVRDNNFDGIGGKVINTQSDGSGTHKAWDISANVVSNHVRQGIALTNVSNTRVAKNKISGSRQFDEIDPDRNETSAQSVSAPHIFVVATRFPDTTAEVNQESITIEDNELLGPSIRGISVVAIDNTDADAPVRLQNVTVTGNRLSDMTTGISLKAARTARLGGVEATHNTITRMGGGGVSIGTIDAERDEGETGTASHGAITVANNTITECDDWGVVLIPMSSGTVDVHHNDLTQNRYAVAKNEFHTPDDHSVYANNITDNTYGAINGGSVALDVRDNWWGHASGPGGEGGRTNPAGRVIGRGDEIRDRGEVLFDPWRRKEVDT